MKLKGRIVLLTGVARIGQAVAKALIDRGCDLLVTYRTSKESAEQVASYAKSQGRRVILLKTDLTLNNKLADIIPKVKQSFGRLDILINMASTYEKKSLKEVGIPEWDKAVGTNLKHVYYLSLKAAGLMKKSGGGRIINFSDWTVRSGRPRYKGFVPYYTAKAGVAGLTQALALELAPEILVNEIAPGPIVPPAAGISKKEMEEVKKATPLKRWGGAEEIVKAVLFLIDSDFVTGEHIRVDGGRHLF